MQWERQPVSYPDMQRMRRSYRWHTRTSCATKAAPTIRRLCSVYLEQQPWPRRDALCISAGARQRSNLSANTRSYRVGNCLYIHVCISIYIYAASIYVYLFIYAYTYTYICILIYGRLWTWSRMVLKLMGSIKRNWACRREQKLLLDCFVVVFSL